MRYLSTWLAVICMIVPVPTVRGHEPQAWEPAALTDDIPYQSLEELRSFYKLSTGVKSTQKGAFAIGNPDLNIEFGPGLREMRIGGVNVELCYPLRKDAAGNWLISRMDWVKWVDPILRPTYIHDRAKISTVVIDPGHGGHDMGMKTAQINEPETTLQVASKLREELVRMGYKVALTRSGDYFLSDQQRVDVAQAAADAEQALFVSLHLNGGHAGAQGPTVYILSPSEDDAHARPGNKFDSRHAALAYALQSALAACSGTRGGGCRHVRYSLLSSIPAPAAWIELGYATHEQEGPTLATPAYQTKLAQAIAQGIATYAKATDPTATIPVQQQRVPTKPVATPPAKTATNASSKGRSGSSQGSKSNTSTKTRNSTRRTRSSR